MKTNKYDIEKIRNRAAGSPNVRSTKISIHTFFENLNTTDINFIVFHIVPIKNNINKKEISTTVASTGERNNFKRVIAFRMRKTKIITRVKGGQMVNNFE